MRSVILITFICFSSSFATFVINADFAEEQTHEGNNLGAFNIASLVKKFGYKFETHKVTTEDGYNLELHRVPSPINDTNTAKRPPILIMHGLLGCSADFFHIGVGKSLPLVLVDVGYDVWLGNSRGNSWSRRHTTIKPDTNETFWDFSFHEMGLYDLPAMIDGILNETKAEKLSFVGHSTGATQFFIMASMKPEYNDKINVMTALAPIVYVKHATSLLLQLVSNKTYSLILGIEQKLGKSEFLGHNLIIETATKALCKEGSKFQGICSGLFFILLGFDSSQLNKTVLPDFLRSFPAGTSFKEINHFLQLKISGEFKQFDYGKIGNPGKYPDSTPPLYDLSKVSTPVTIYYGRNDLIVQGSDITQLANELPHAETFPLEYKKFNHWDFLLANDVNDLANYYIINTLNKYNNISQITSTTTPTTTTIPTTKTIPTTTTKIPITTTIPTTPDSSSTTNQPSSSSTVIPSHIVVLLFSIAGLLNQY